MPAERCPVCDNRLGDRVHIVYDHSRDGTPTVICDYCYRNRYTECCVCHDMVRNGNTNCAQTPDGEQRICETCQSLLAHYCRYCGNIHLVLEDGVDYHRIQPGMNRVCPTCINDVIVCDSCSNIVDRRSAYEERLCMSCAADQGLIVSIRNHSHKPMPMFFLSTSNNRNETSRPT